MNCFAGNLRLTPRTLLALAAWTGGWGASLLGLVPAALCAAEPARSVPVMQAAPALAPTLDDEAPPPEVVKKTAPAAAKPVSPPTAPAPLPTILPPQGPPPFAPPFTPAAAPPFVPLATRPNAPAQVAAPALAPAAAPPKFEMPAALPIAGTLPGTTPAPKPVASAPAAANTPAAPAYSRDAFTPAGPQQASSKAEQYGFSRGPRVEPNATATSNPTALPPIVSPSAAQRTGVQPAGPALIEKPQSPAASPIPSSAAPATVARASANKGVVTTLPLNLAPTRPVAERPAPVPPPAPTTRVASTPPTMLRITPAVAQLEADDPLLPAGPQPAVPVAPQPAVPLGPPRILPADPLPGPLGGGGPVALDDRFDLIEASGSLEVGYRRSILLRTKSDIYRTAVVDPSICDVVQFTPREVSIIGKGQGATNVTFWFNDGKHLPVTYVVKVKPDLEERRRIEGQYKLLQDIVREQFPDSKVYLIPVADKLIVRGQAKDGEEAAQIMAIVRGQSGSQSSMFNQSYNLLAQGTAAQVLTGQETGRQPWPRMQVINMLRVPGIQQVALRVKIAELNRSAARGFGVDVVADVDFGGTSALLLNSVLNSAAGGAPALLAQFDGDDIQIGVRYLQQHGVVRVLSEPTLVTMSGRPATFVAGGEFAVPTVVGSAGLNAVTTDFRAYGVIISFLPIVLDKDRIQIQVAPEFSQINSDNSVGGVPGLNVRAVTTTVEMREGQTLAIAGLLDESMKATSAGDLPFLAQIFGHRDVSRNETELIILVTPELVHPMEPEEVPPLPGYDVTEPNNKQFFLHGDLEGDPNREYRSTIWHRLRSRYISGGGSGMISGQFGHGG